LIHQQCRQNRFVDRSAKAETEETAGSKEFRWRFIFTVLPVPLSELAFGGGGVVTLFVDL
jgi:hypothetical protein